MHGVKPDLSNHQQFGVEAYLHRRPDQRTDSKFDARGEPGIFVGYPSNQLGYLVWCPGRGPNAVVSTTNVFFGINLPQATRPVMEIISGTAQELPLTERPSVLNLKDLRTTSDTKIIGTFENHFVVSGSGLPGFRLLAPSDFMTTLAFTHEHNLSSAHLSLIDSYTMYDASIPANIFAQEVSSARPVPRNISEALSPAFVGEFGPAMDKRK